MSELKLKALPDNLPDYQIQALNDFIDRFILNRNPPKKIRKVKPKVKPPKSAAPKRAKGSGRPRVLLPNLTWEDLSEEEKQKLDVKTKASLYGRSFYEQHKEELREKARKRYQLKKQKIIEVSDEEPETLSEEEN